MEKKRRAGIVDAWRMVAVLIIMMYHLKDIGFELGNYPFSTGWIYVEFFFILTGYFTVMHFVNINKNEVTDICKESILYTIKKFAVFFPYIVIAVTLKYLIDFQNEKFSVGNLINYVFDVLLLKGAFRGDCLSVAPLWYLSALLIVFPLFCVLCQLKSRYTLYFISFYMIVLFYGMFESITFSRFPEHYLRALSGLFLGVIVYGLVDIIKKVNMSKWQKSVLTGIELGIMLFILFSTYCNKLHVRFYLLCFVIALSIMLSGQSYTVVIRGTVFDYLGKLSMVIYIMHMNLAHAISCFCPEISKSQKLIIYIGGGIILSLVTFWFVENICKRWNMLKNQI